MLRAPARYAALTVSGTAVAVVGTFLAVSPAQSDGHRGAGEGGQSHHRLIQLHADLDGSNELAAGTLTPGAGDLDGSGEADVSIDRRPQTGMVSLCWDIDVEDIAPATRAHIHAGDSEVNGPIVVAFFDTIETQMLDGCTLVERDLARQIQRSPGDYYVNVHNAEFPGGAVRGQLRHD